MPWNPCLQPYQIGATTGHTVKFRISQTISETKSNRWLLLLPLDSSMVKISETSRDIAGDIRSLSPETTVAGPTRCLCVEHTAPRGPRITLWKLDNMFDKWKKDFPLSIAEHLLVLRDLSFSFLHALNSSDILKRSLRQLIKILVLSLFHTLSVGTFILLYDEMLARNRILQRAWHYFQLCSEFIAWKWKWIGQWQNSNTGVITRSEIIFDLYDSGAPIQNNRRWLQYRAPSVYGSIYIPFERMQTTLNIRAQWSNTSVPPLFHTSW